MKFVNWQNPYQEKSGNWFRGSLHCHCRPTSPCASISLDPLLKAYIEKGYDFLFVSNHLTITSVQSKKITLLPGLEWNSRAGLMPNLTLTRHDHVGVYSPDPATIADSLRSRTLQTLLASASPPSQLRVANHPDWLFDEHYPFATLLRFADRLDGMEIYNAGVDSDEGEADSTWKWDKLLSSGHPILGFASDDSHAFGDIGRAWLMVSAKDGTMAQVFGSLKRGSFYCSTGVMIDELGRDGDRVWIKLAEKAKKRVIGSYGRILEEQCGASMGYNFSEAETSYIRFQILNSSWKQAWSQPFFLAELPRCATT